MQWALPPPWAKSRSSGSSTVMPSARRAALVRGGMARRQHAPVAKRQHIAGHVGHRLAVADVDQADLVIAQPVEERRAAAPRCRPAPGPGAHIEKITSRCRKWSSKGTTITSHPSSRSQPAYCSAPSAIGAPAGRADGGKAGADQVDIATLDRPGRRHLPHRPVEVQHRRHIPRAVAAWPAWSGPDRRGDTCELSRV